VRNKFGKSFLTGTD